MASLQTRVVNILTSPQTEWPVIAGESTDVGRLYREYIVLLAAIGPVASFVGTALFGAILPFGGVYRPTMMGGLSAMVVSYVMGLVGVFLCAVIVEWLAPKFKSSGSRVDALKLVAYASTPAWVAGVLNLVPGLAVLGLLAALYAVYLFYLGLPVLMKTPADQVVIYMVVAAIAVIVVGMAMAAISAMLAGAGMMSAF